MNETQPVEILEEFLRSRAWQVEKLGQKPTYRLTIPAGDDQFVGYALLHPTEFMFYPLAPLSVSPDQFSPVAEYLARINHWLWTHDFELDYETGQIRCKASFAFRDMLLDVQLVENTIHNTVEAMLTYLPGLAEVLAGTKTPAQVAEGLRPAPPDERQSGDGAQTLYKTVVQFYEAEGWDYQQHYDYYTRVNYAGRNRDTYFCYATMLASQKKFLFDVRLQGVSDQQKIPAVVKWITWVNYNLKIGYFNFDFAESALSFINGIDFYGMMPTTLLLRNVIYPTLNTGDKYWPYLKRVIEGTAVQDSIPPEMPALTNH